MSINLFHSALWKYNLTSECVFAYLLLDETIYLIPELICYIFEVRGVSESVPTCSEKQQLFTDSSSQISQLLYCIRTKTDPGQSEEPRAPAHPEWWKVCPTIGTVQHFIDGSPTRFCLVICFRNAQAPSDDLTGKIPFNIRAELMVQIFCCWCFLMIIFWLSHEQYVF